jgi:N-acetylmuramoyl-L-alanine amidase
MKARVTGGTCGRTTGVYEYELTLAISQQLRDELESRGYTVYMTRESHDVNISNMERAQYATSVGADITVRIHANGSDNAAASGALALAPSYNNPYISYLASDSQYLSQCVLNAYCAATGLNNQGVSGNDTMTGINWCTMPVTILEMGYMTNASDDVNMENAAFQQQMVQGIANGIDTYFGF